MSADNLEQLANEPVGRPVRHTDLAAGFTYAQHFRRGFFLIRREHHAKGRDDGIKAGVLEWELFGVSFPELNWKAFCIAARTSSLEQCRHIIRGSNLAPAPGRGERDVTIAGGDVEYLLSSPQIHRLAQALADNLKRRTYDGVVARCPDQLLFFLYWGEIRA